MLAFSWFMPRASGSCTEILSSISMPFSNSTRSAMFPNMLYLDNACAPIATTCFISLVRPGHFFFYTWATILSPGLLEGGWWPFSQDYFSPLLTQRLIKNSGWCYWVIYYCDIRESLGVIALVILYRCNAIRSSLRLISFVLSYHIVPPLQFILRTTR